MIRRYGIDTSILVRLLTGDPPESFALCVDRLTALIERGEVFASNQVIGEAYVAVQHHYGVDKKSAREGLFSVLRSGLVAPLGGPQVFEALKARGGCGLLDRLIALDYRDADLEVLTLDERMGRLPRSRLLT
ncbi:MAG: PIN domain-containing protein [Acidobacteria bacterium]|nr:PIN domain-containing protein [Acidobacteriota bacterium]